MQAPAHQREPSVRPTASVPCRSCGGHAAFRDRYQTPFLEDRVIFTDAMGVYWCDREQIGFAHPTPSTDALRRYYREIYRDPHRQCAEDPHRYYTSVTHTPLVESQFMYLSQFINWETVRTVIDIGCGHGMLLRRIREGLPTARLIGVEVDPAVGPFLRTIGAEHLEASADANIDVICSRITDGTLLISSHVLHYQRDVVSLRDLIQETKRRGVRPVSLFVEVPNDPLGDPTFAERRVYDVPKLTFFTPDAFRRGAFGLETVHVATTGWMLAEELRYRQQRVERYQRGGGPPGLREVLRFGESLVPVRARMALRAALAGTRATDAASPYFSYGGPRRAIRMIGRVAP